MKGNAWATTAIAGILASLLSLGAVGCVITAFSLPLAGSGVVAGSCVFAAFLTALALGFRGGGLGLLALGGGMAWYLWRQGAEPFLQLITHLSHVYDNAYGWGILQLTDRYGGPLDLPMAVLGAAIAVTAAWTVRRGENALFAVSLPLLALLTCLVVTDTVPAAGCLFLLCWGMLLLLLTSRVRSFDHGQANRLTALIALPTFLFLLVLFWAVPQEGYVNRSAAFRERVINWFDGLTQSGEVSAVPSITPNRSPDRLDLAALGPRQVSQAPVLDVTADVGGSLYLRGLDYDVYDGTGWSAAPNRVEELACRGLDLGRVTVRTYGRMGEVYLPYYPGGGRSLVGGRLDNSQLYTEYTFSRTGLPELWQESLSSGQTYPLAPEPQADYLALPETTRPGAEAILAGLTLGTSATDRATAIGAYVRTCARYDQNAARMPDGTPDFALWFLEEADRGYCVHFATAAVVLLRAAGVEARYVTGYQVQALPGVTATATGENAHAWAEYYEPALGVWMVLDATPSDDAQGSAAQPPEAPETAPTVAAETQGAETEAPRTERPEPAPGEAEPSEPASRRLPGWLGKLTTGVLLLAAALGAVEGQRRLRLRLRRRRQSAGSPNVRALRRWREAERLWKCLRSPVPQELLELAQRAKFSQHTLTDQELSRMDALLTAARVRLMKAPWYARLIHQYIFALY